MNPRIAATRNRQPTALPKGLTVTDRLTRSPVQLEPGLKAETYHHRRYRGWPIAKARRARWHKARTNAPWQPGWLSGRISDDQRRARGELVGENQPNPKGKTP